MRFSLVYKLRCLNLFRAGRHKLKRVSKSSNETLTWNFRVADTVAYANFSIIAQFAWSYKFDVIKFLNQQKFTYQLVFSAAHIRRTDLNAQLMATDTGTFRWGKFHDRKSPYFHKQHLKALKLSRNKICLKMQTSWLSMLCKFRMNALTIKAFLFVWT